jgi:hypothetical protein
MPFGDLLYGEEGTDAGVPKRRWLLILHGIAGQ